MKTNIPSVKNNSRAAAHAGKGRGMALPAPVQRFPLTNPVVQRVGEAKASIKQPDSKDQSKDVPDLPDTIATELTVAQIDDKKRPGALDSLMSYLKKSGAIETPDEVEGPDIEIFATYNPSSGGQRLAYTQYVSNGKETQVVLHVYASLFTKSIPAIYSTIRHELIHAAQQTQSADDKTSKDDEYIFGMEKDTENVFNKKVIAPLQEIETHSWELIHSSETGIGSDKEYLKETVTYLEDYTNKVIKVIKGGRTNKKEVKLFGGYIEKAIGHLRNIPDNAGDKLADELEQAYNEKVAKVGRKRKGGTKKKKEDKKSKQEKEEDSDDEKEKKEEKIDI